MKKVVLISMLYFFPLYWAFLSKQTGTGGEICAQNHHVIDSLKQLLEYSKSSLTESHRNSPAMSDSVTANILSELSKEYWYVDYDKASDYANQCLDLSKQIGYKKGIAKAYNGMGVINLYQGNYIRAHEFLRKALAIRKEIGDQKDIASTLGNIGSAYYSQAIYEEALKYNFEALKVNERIGNKIYQADNYENIGSVYSDMGNFDMALKYLNMCLKIREESNEKDRLVMTITTIGELYSRQGNYHEALNSFNKALELIKSEPESGLNATLFISAGKTNYKYGDYDESLKNLFAGLKLSNELGEKSGIADCYIFIGATYTMQGKYLDAAESLNKGLIQSMAIGGLERIRDSYENLAKLDSAQGNFANALRNYKLYVKYRDIMQNNEISHKTAALHSQYEIEKKEQQIALLNTDKQIKHKEISKRKTERNGFIAGCILLLMIGGVAYNRYQVKQKTNKKLSEALMQLKQAQQQLIEQEKLASLGQLTAGIAHEIQNPLNFVINFSELSWELFDDLKDENLQIRNDAIADLEDNLSKIERHGLRANGIVQSMLLHSKDGDFKKLLTNLNVLCSEALTFSWQAMSMSNPDFKCAHQISFDETIPQVNIMQQDISSVIINLLNNAFYAMHEKKQSIQATADYEPEIKIQTSFSDGKVHLKVSDNGNGIPKEVRNKIFQPFFTTKPTHLGTGLGLSISYDIVKAHGGNLVVANTSEKGTEFVLTLPV